MFKSCKKSISSLIIYFLKKFVILIFLFCFELFIFSESNAAVIIDSYVPTNLTPAINEGEYKTFKISANSNNALPITYVWFFDGKRLLNDTSIFVYFADTLSSGRHKIVVSATDDAGISVTQQEWTMTVINMDNACGDGVWNIGEDINNCPADSNSYSIPPAGKVDMLDTGDHTVGMFIFPDWNGDPQILRKKWDWVINATKSLDPRQEQPKKPIMNYYDDSNPVAVDWMIHWALTYGVNLFVYDWYNSYDTELPVNIFLEELYGKFTPYKDKVKFSLMWANHNSDDTHDSVLSKLDRAEQGFFSRNNYFKIDNKPVFMIFSIQNLMQSMGLPNTIQLLKDMKSMMVSRGYAGLYIIALNYECDLNGSEPFPVEGVTAYNYSPSSVETYDNYFARYKNRWTQVYNSCQKQVNLDGKPINIFPPVSPGWDNTALQGKTDYIFPYFSSVVEGTPDKFKVMLQTAKDSLDQKGVTPKLTLIGAWDEWSEGSVLAPRSDLWGFKYLEAVRSVFGKIKSPAPPTGLIVK